MLAPLSCGMRIKVNLRKPLPLRGNEACFIFNEALLIPATGNAVRVSDECNMCKCFVGLSWK